MCDSMGRGGTSTVIQFLQRKEKASQDKTHEIRFRELDAENEYILKQNSSWGPDNQVLTFAKIVPEDGYIGKVIIIE